MANASKKDQFIGIHDIEANSVVLKIGRAVLDEPEEVSVISLFENGNEGYLVEFLAGLGRYGLFSITVDCLTTLG